jgi:hypothetical protein
MTLSQPRPTRLIENAPLPEILKIKYGIRAVDFGYGDRNPRPDRHIADHSVLGKPGI